MNLAVLQIFLWTLVASLTGSAIWYFKKPNQVYEIPDEEPRLFLRHEEANPDEGIVDMNQYKPFEQLKWVNIRPPVSAKVQVIEKPVQAPYNLTRVVSSRIVELLSLKDRIKRTYLIGQDISEREGVKKKKVGKIIKLNSQEDTYQLEIEYQGKEYILELAKEKAPLVDRIGKVKNKRRYVNRKPEALEEHEGRQVSANSYELNYEFFNAVINDAADEGQKIQFIQNSEGNFRVTRLAEDSVLRKFGFAENDVLVGFNGEPIKDVRAIKEGYKKFVFGGQSQAKIRVLRGGKRINLDFSILNNPGKFKEFYE